MAFLSKITTSYSRIKTAVAGSAEKLRKKTAGILRSITSMPAKIKDVFVGSFVFDVTILWWVGIGVILGALFF